MPTRAAPRTRRRRSSSTLETGQIPMQPVEKPILCKPYEEPCKHWLYDRETGEASEIPRPTTRRTLVQDGTLHLGPAGPTVRRGELGRAAPRESPARRREALAEFGLPKRHQRHPTALRPLAARGQDSAAVLLPGGSSRNRDLPRRNPHGRQADGFQAAFRGRRYCQAG